MRVANGMVESTYIVPCHPVSQLLLVLLSVLIIPPYCLRPQIVLLVCVRAVISLASWTYTAGAHYSESYSAQQKRIQKPNEVCRLC